jgi:phosphoenolpyruvate carboxykinase (ATP)
MVEAPQKRATHPDNALAIHGIQPSRQVQWNLVPAKLYDESIRRREGVLASHGPLAVTTGEYTGRSPKDKFFVEEPSSAGNIWWGSVNQPFDQAKFNALHQRVASYLGQRDLFVQDLQVGADPSYQLSVRVITERAWHSLFARNLFIRPSRAELGSMTPAFTILQAPGFSAIPDRDGTLTKTFVIADLSQRLILVGGTEYAGEIKKSIFSIMNYLMPLRGVMSMHCSANVGPGGDVALFFGLSGTGKTTLSADPSRVLIGDDEHGWSDNGVFNYEGGCYAKVINLSPAAEPEIYATTRLFGTVLENVVLDSDTHEIDYDDDSLTENTRAAYPIDMIANASETGMAGHPNNILFLTADAFGVLPPIAKLTPDQASYYFLSGYTAKVAGTERGLTEPEATFSSCFGSPFLTLHPNDYGRLLREKILKHQPNVWLVNTGWTGGAYGVGQRMPIKHTRAIVSAALAGQLDGVETRQDPVFGIHVPVHVPSVPDEILFPVNTWKDRDAYERTAKHLAREFVKDFAQYADQVDEAIRQAGPNPD